MIPAVAWVGLVFLVVVCARARGRRLAARHAASDRVEARVTEVAQKRAALIAGELVQLRRDLGGQLAETSERLFHVEQDRDELQHIAARHLRRAWRAERALTAVWARDEHAAYVEQAARSMVAAAERMTREAVR